MDLSQFLTPGVFIDSDSPQVRMFVMQTIANLAEPRPLILQLYAAIRDNIIYDPYVNFADPANFRAS